MQRFDELNTNTAAELNKIILNGGIILWPSGGVYGLACDATCKQAVEKIYAIKKRDNGKPLSIIASKNTARIYGELSNNAGRIINILWPDFIGVIVKKKKIIPDFVTCGNDTVALVCSSFYNEFLAENIVKPLASTSANISGDKEIIDFETAFKTFNGLADAAIYCDDNNGYLNTLTAFDSNDNFSVLRNGKYTISQIKKLLTL